MRITDCSTRERVLSATAPTRRPRFSSARAPSRAAPRRHEGVVHHLVEARAGERAADAPLGLDARRLGRQRRQSRGAAARDVVVAVDAGDLLHQVLLALHVHARQRGTSHVVCPAPRPRLKPSAPRMRADLLLRHRRRRAAPPPARSAAPPLRGSAGCGLHVHPARRHRAAGQLGDQRRGAVERRGAPRRGPRRARSGARPRVCSSCRRAIRRTAPGSGSSRTRAARASSRRSPRCRRRPSRRPAPAPASQSAMTRSSRVERPLLAVERGQLLALASRARTTISGPRPCPGRRRAAAGRLQHHVVGDVHHVVDGAHAARLQPRPASTAATGRCARPRPRARRSAGTPTGSSIAHLHRVRGRRARLGGLRLAAASAARARQHAPPRARRPGARARRGRFGVTFTSSTVSSSPSAFGDAASRRPASGEQDEQPARTPRRAPAPSPSRASRSSPRRGALAA